MSDPTPPRICLGCITGAHGLKGEVKAQAAIDDLETLAALASLEINGVAYRVEAARFHKNSLVLSLAGVTTRNQAEWLVGREIWIDRQQLPPLPEGEYYWFEILGLEVFRADTGACLGKVTAIMPTPGHDVYVVQGTTGEYLIPAVAEAIVAIEPEPGRIVVAPAGVAD